jgi:hypothetical protein
VSQTGTPEGDQLLRMIRQLVHGRVHPSQEEIVVEIVARVVVHIFNDPNFYSHLRLVIDLQSRIVQLERALAITTQQQRVARPVKKAAKKMPVKKAAPVKKASKRAYPNVKQFKRGAAGR